MGQLFDPCSADTRHNVYARYKLLRDEHPVYYNPDREFFALSRYEDVQAAARDWKTFSSAGGVDLDYTGQQLQGPGDFLELDPPRHDILRDIVRRFFAPKSIATLAPLVEQEVRDLVDAFVERGSADFARDLAWPLPVHVGSRLLGVPEADRDMLADTFRRSFRRDLETAEIPADAREAASVIHEYFAELADERRRSPKDDVVSLIAQAEIDGERLTDEVTGMSYLVFSAAIETTSSLISNALHLLAEYPEQRSYLWEDAAHMPKAIEELLRFITPVQNLMRTTTTDATIREHTIPEGSRVLLLFASANRDERVFDRPDELDLSRTARRHLGFGEGIHFCLGAHLARLEGRTALAEIGRRIPEYSLAGAVSQSNKQNERGLTTLPVTFPVHAAASRG